MPRGHAESLTKRFASNDEFVGPDKYEPRFGQTQRNISHKMAFSTRQPERRTLYFEGGPAELVHTQNRFNMLQTVWAERGNLATAPICSKGDSSTCYKSIKRVQATIKKDYQLQNQRAQLYSGGTNMLSSMMGSEDLLGDGVLIEKSG